MIKDKRSADQRLETQLLRRKKAGARDVKCHIEVTNFTEPRAVKEVLADVFEREERGEVPSRPLSSFGNFTGLKKEFGL
ncbi:MAG: hypothetical protein ACSHYC_05870 [Alphaproteobacteria bacterium]